MTIESLRNTGAKVFVSHSRFYKTGDSPDGFTLVSNKELKNMREMGTYDFNKLSHRGGRTEVSILLTDGTRLSGVATCSLLDNFNRALGRNIAFGRALTPFLKEIRQELKDSI